MRHCLPFLLTILSLGTAKAQFPPGFAAISIVQDLDPTAMALAPNGDIFIAEKHGRVLIVRDGQALPQPFMELAVDNYNERGLSGIAIHPNYPDSPFVYLYFTVPGANRNRVARVRAAGDEAVAGSMETLLDLDTLTTTVHNGGALLFGPDGMLYVAVGDGAGWDVAQSPQSLLGKILRLQPDGGIPPDNPFYQYATGPYRSIWAIGLRNPFTFTIQPGTGRMVVGDVGSDQFEELNLITKGKNYGWPLTEGFWQSGDNPPANYRDPFHAYGHAEGCCVAGAAFYNPATAQFPANYSGQLFFGDYCEGRIWYIDPVFGGTAMVFATGLDRPIGLLTHPDGSLYGLARGGLGGGSSQDNTSSGEGVLWKILYNPTGAPLVAAQPAGALHAVGEKALFTVKAAGNPPFSYQWQRDGADLAGAVADSLLLPGVSPADSGAVFSCRISNANGTAWSNTALLRVTTNQRPSAEIQLPVHGATYAAGQSLVFQGAGNDPETGPIPPEQMGWRVAFHHGHHTHPVLPYTPGFSTDSIQIPQVGETAHDVWYRVHLYVQDDAGLSRHVWRDVFPQKSVLTFQTQPDSLTLLLDGQPVQSPVSDTTVVGVLRNIMAPTLANADGQTYFFAGWSNGAPEKNLILETPPQDLTLTADYEPIPAGDGTGLLGLYYNGDLDQPVAAWRIDPQLDFFWSGGPFDTVIGPDNFTVRWLGEIEPWHTDDYYFHLTADDGVRLWVDDSLLINSWVPSSGHTRTSGPVHLEAGERYPLRVEFLELYGDAKIKLEWGFVDGGQIPVPTTQLYPAPFVPTDNLPSTGDLRCLIVPNPFRGAGLLEVFTPHRTDVQVAVYDRTGHSVNHQTWVADPGFSPCDLRLGEAPPGQYWVKITTSAGSVTLKTAKF